MAVDQARRGVDAQQDAQQALVQDHARPWRFLFGGQVGGEIA